MQMGWFRFQLVLISMVSIVLDKFIVPRYILIMKHCRIVNSEQKSPDRVKITTTLQATNILSHKTTRLTTVCSQLHSYNVLYAFYLFIGKEQNIRITR